MLRNILVSLGVGVLGACGSGGGDETIDITHDACTPIGVTTASSTQPQAIGISDALQMWRERGVPMLGDSGETAIEVRFERAAPSFYGLYDDESGIIFINDAITDPSSLSIVIAHELGHAFGLPHITDRTSLMNPGNVATAANEADAAALQALWGRCAP